MTLIFWLCQHPLGVTNCCFTNACMRVEPSQEINNEYCFLDFQMLKNM